MAALKYFTKEKFIEYISKFSLPEPIQELFWKSRPDGSNLLDPEIIDMNGELLEKLFTDCKDCPDQKECLSRLDIEKEEEFPPSMIN